MKIRDNLVGFLMISDDNFEWPNCVQYSHLCCVGMTNQSSKCCFKKIWFGSERGTSYKRPSHHFEKQ